MGLGRFLSASIVAIVLLMVLNAVVFPLVFPDGLAEKFVNARDPQLTSYHALAFAATGLLLTSVVAASREPTPQRGVVLGVLRGLLVALPEHLHLYAMTTASASRQFVPILWTGTTWGLVTAAAGRILAGRRQAVPVSGAPAA